MDRRISELGIAFVLCVCLIAPLGCGRSSTEPTPYYQVTLEVRLFEESVGGVVTNIGAVATARNTGLLPVSYVEACSSARGPYFTMFDSEGNWVRLRSACRPTSGCPPLFGLLDPGETATKTFLFDGTTWDSCYKQPALPGHYELLVKFFYWTTQDTDSYESRKVTTATEPFDWVGFAPVFRTVK